VKSDRGGIVLEKFFKNRFISLNAYPSTAFERFAAIQPLVINATKYLLVTSRNGIRLRGA
jgi:hypothetical protein